MIICPNCKEEIEDGSYYCDQCGQALYYCDRCGRVGIGRRCTQCGGLMLSPDKFMEAGARGSLGTSVSSGFVSQGFETSRSSRRSDGNIGGPDGLMGMPQLLLSNPSLGINIAGINGAIIGRRQGPYTQFFQQNMYVSGVHAQLKFNAGSGWCITDKHSSNGTRLNDHSLQPDVDMSIKNGDIITIANVSLQVSIN